MHDEIRGRPGPESKGPLSAFVPTQEWRNSETLKLLESLKSYQTAPATTSTFCRFYAFPHFRPADVPAIDGALAHSTRVTAF